MILKKILKKKILKKKKMKKKKWRTARLQSCACTDIYWTGIMFRKDEFAFTGFQVYVQHSTNIPKTTVTSTPAKP